MKTLFDSLRRMKLPNCDFAVFGSGPLIVRGLIPVTNDLDIVCRGAAWDKIREIGTLQFNDAYGVEIVTFYDGQVTFGNRWGIGNFDVNELIDGAEFIEKLPFVQLKHVVEYKMERASEKDLRHLELLRQSKYVALIGDTD
ncbi:MAG: hypothetical protein V3T31_02200 [candidate division Zixibacteria bacterium]